ncbi:MAG: hypothetical protein V1684_01250 [bacterium]
MPTCEECKFYKPVSEREGDCFGHRIPSEMDAEECPTQSFQPEEEK